MFSALGENKLGEIIRTKSVQPPKQFSFISAVETPTSLLGRAQFELQKGAEAERQKVQRGDIETFGAAKSFFFGAGASVIGTVQFGQQLVTDPIGTTKAVGSGLFSFIKSPAGKGKKVGKIILQDPAFAAGFVGSEIAQAKFGGFLFSKGGDVFDVARARASPVFTPTISDDAGRFFKIGGKADDAIDVRLVELGEDIRLTPKQQAGFAGKEVDAVSAGRDVFGTFKKDLVVRKPISNEASLTTRTKTLLDKFDSGKINTKELVELNKNLKLEGGGGILETSFFADPQGRLRISRLGLDQPQASFKDILSGDITFRKAKSQAIIFESTKVADFPADLQKVANKLKNNQALTKAEELKLLQWQLQKTGEFKPIGFAGPEPEITLAPGEVAKKGKKVGTTIINGKKVDVFSSEVVKLTPESQRLINKFKSGSISPDELNKLNKNLIKETGFSSPLGSSIPVLSSGTITGPAVSVIGSLFGSGGSSSSTSVSSASVTSPISSLFGTSSKTTSSPISRTSSSPISSIFGSSPISSISSSSRPSGTSSISSLIGGSSFGSPSGSSSGSGSGSSSSFFGGGSVTPPPFGGGSVTPPPPPKRGKDERKSAWRVQVRKGMGPVKSLKKVQWRNVKSKPLTKTNALSKGSRIVDRTTAATFRLKPTKQKLKKQKVDSYWSRNQQKFRPFTFRSGQKVKTAEHTYIEKRKFRIDTQGEREGIPYKGQLVRKRKKRAKVTRSNVRKVFGF